jgi:hypothetical protein
MGFAMTFDAGNNVLCVTLEGPVTDSFLRDLYTALTRYVAARPPSHGIMDFSGATKFEVSSNTTRQLAQSSSAIPPEYMRVLVAPQDSVYGTLRMFQMLGETNRPNLHIVRTMDEAYRLLRVQTPQFSPVI